MLSLSLFSLLLSIVVLVVFVVLVIAVVVLLVLASDAGEVIHYGRALSLGHVKTLKASGLCGFARLSHIQRVAEMLTEEVLPPKESPKP